MVVCLLATIASREGRWLQHCLQAILFERFGEGGCLLWCSKCVSLHTLEWGIPESAFHDALGAKGARGKQQSFPGIRLAVA